MELLTPILQAIGLFVATNIDDIIVLSLFYARGNFRLLERLFPQIPRVLKINELDTITNDVIEAAQSTLVIGVT